MKNILDDLKKDLIPIKNAKEIHQKAQKKDPDSLLIMAKMLITGHLVDSQNIEMGINLLNEIKDKKDGEPEYIIARLFIDNIVENEDKKNFGLDEMEKSSAKGNIDALLFLGFSALHGINGIEQNLDIADKNLRRLSKIGNTKAQFELGVMYELGKEGKIKPDYNEAIRWFKESSKEINEAFVKLAKIYKKGGFGIEKNLDESIKNYKLFLEKNKNNEVENELAYTYIEKGKEIIKEKTISEIDKNNLILLNKIEIL